MFRERLIREKSATEAELTAIEERLHREIEEAAAFGEASSYPEVSESLTDVYSVDNERCVER